MSQIISTYGVMLITAMGQTLLLALFGLFFGCILGIIFGLSSVVNNKFSNLIAKVYVNIIRGVPMIVLAFFVFYGVPYGLKSIFGIRSVLTALQAGTICLALNCGAYMSEIIRAGIQSIDPGQMEAARSLGLGYWRSMFRVVLPQAIKNILPTLGNEFIALVKETAVVGYVGAIDITVAFQYQGSNSYEYMIPYLVMALLYIVIVAIIAGGVKLMERMLAKSERRQ